MLKVYLGSCDKEIYNPPAYFINQYEDEWLVTDLAKDMIKDVDKSEVIGPRLIQSPVLGPISPRELSGGVKTLLLMAFDESGRLFNATAFGDNCAKWILKIAEEKDLTICLHHSMNFGPGPYEIKILNNDCIVHNQEEWLDVVYDYL